MTADKPSHLVPRLRFAEFVDEPPWECPPLKKLAKRITQRNTHGADLRALTNSAENGVVDQREYFDRDIATKTDNYYVVEPGDYVYNPRISSTAPVGPISKNQIGSGVISPLYTLAIRLTPMTATCRVPPLSRVKLGIGWSRGVARDAEQ